MEKLHTTVEICMTVSSNSNLDEKNDFSQPVTLSHGVFVKDVLNIQVR